MEWDKNLIVEGFCKPDKDNNECMILIAIDLYVMSIDNQDVKLIIYEDYSLLFNFIIQCMGQVGKKGGLLAFILLNPKWTRVKDLDEIEKRINSISFILANAQLLDSN